MELSRQEDAWRHNPLDGWQNAALDEAPPQATPRQMAAPRTTGALGVDISSYQGANIDWGQVAASGRKFAMIKSTEGTTYVSPTLDAQFQGAKAAGVLTGLYHYGTPSATSSPEAEADAFAVQINRLGAIAGHMPPCLDLETGTGDLSGWAQRFITRLRAQTGCVRILLYSGAAFMQSQLLTSNWLDANIALWVAAWSSPPGAPPITNSHVAMHQYSAAGAVSGITGNVDLDIAMWDLSVLVPGVASPPVTPAPPATTASDLTSTEDQALISIYGQLSGSNTVGQWPGWPAWPGGSGGSRTLVDMGRQSDVQHVSILNQLAAIKAELDALKASVDPAAIAAAVAQALATRLAS